MARYALTIFLSAFLLFQVQPMIGKFILPWYGGGPAVWTACMLFFQVFLLGGYAYAHLVASRMTPRAGASLHWFLLVASLLFLPIAPNEEIWKQAVENGAGRADRGAPGGDHWAAVLPALVHRAACCRRAFAARRAIRPTGCTRCRTSVRCWRC